MDFRSLLKIFLVSKQIVIIYVSQTFYFFMLNSKYITYIIMYHDVSLISLIIITYTTYLTINYYLF